MEAPFDHPDALVRPWRRATIAASLVAGVELIGLVLLAFLLLAKPLSRAIEHRATTSGTSTPSVTTKKAPVTHHKLVAPPKVGAPKLSRAQTGVLVLNGNGRTGAAHAAAAQLQHLGYKIRGAANAAHDDYATTVVMFRPGYAAEGKRLGKDVGASVVGPLDGMTLASLHGAQVVVLLGAK